MDDSLTLKTPGKITQSKMGFHGAKGGHFGVEAGQLSLDANKYKLWKQMKNEGILPASKLGGRRPSITKQRKRNSNVNNNEIESKEIEVDNKEIEIDNKENEIDNKENDAANNDDEETDKNARCLTGLTFRKQATLIYHYRKLQKKKGDSVFTEAAKKMFGKSRYDKDYPPSTNARKNGRQRVKQIVNDERNIRHSIAAGLGHYKRYTKGSEAKNPMEPQIAIQLRRLANANIKVTTSLLVQVSLQVTANAGIPCGWPGTGDKFIENLESEDIKNCKNIVERSRQNVKTDKNGRIIKQYIFTPTAKWRRYFAQRQGWVYGGQHERQVSLIGLLSNLEPALLYSYSMRRVFNIEPGKGKIMNGDQSMWYRYYQSRKSWQQKAK